MTVIFLDNYYYYSWVRLYKKLNNDTVLNKSLRAISKYKAKSLLVFSDLQLRSIRRLNKFISKFEKLAKKDKLREYMHQRMFRSKFNVSIDLLELRNLGIVNEEDIGIIEFLLIVNNEGKIRSNEVKGTYKIRISKNRIKRFISMLDEGSPTIPLNMETYARHYVLVKIRKILKVKNIEELESTSISVKAFDVSTKAEEIACNLCMKTQECDEVRKDRTIRQHSDDLELIKALIAYIKTKNTKAVVVGIPKTVKKYECFNHALEYIIKTERLEDKIIHIAY